MVELTPEQATAIHGRITATCTLVRVERSAPLRRDVDVTQFDRQRLIETVRIAPGGRVKILP